MEIKIVQDKVNIIRDRYTVYVEGEKRYRAASELLHGSGLSLYKWDDDSTVLLSIKGVLKAFEENVAYDINRDGQEYYFRTKDIAAMHYDCEVGNDLYEIHGHGGRKYSIFKNHEQIAWWSQQKFKLMMADKYSITANSDVDVELVAMFCLIFDFHFYKEGSVGLVGINPERIAPTARKFDKDWQPRR